MEKEYIVAIIGIVGAVIAAMLPVFYTSRKKRNSEVIASQENSTGFSQTLNDVLALAEMQSRRNNDQFTSTRHFFSAALYLCPEEIRDLLKELENTGAMPEPTPQDIADDPRKLLRDRPFSACINDSIASLQPKTSKGSPLTVSDVFVDVAKFGKGSSVEKLRKAKVEPADIDNMVSRYSIVVPHRREA